MAEIFSAEWLKQSVSTKKKSLSSVSNLEHLYAVVLVPDRELRASVSEEIIRLGLNPLTAESPEEAIHFIQTYGAKIVLIISGYSLLDERGRLFREVVLANTNDTPYAILIELDQVADLSPGEIELNPHVYLSPTMPQEPWLNFLRFDVLTRINLLGEEVKLRSAFLQNALNLIQQTEDLVLCLEENPEAMVLLDTIFGNIHTLKGGSSFLQPKNLERFMHRFEDLINQLRTGERLISSVVITSILQILDKSKELIDDLGAERHKIYLVDELEAYFEFAQQEDRRLSSADSPAESLEEQSVSQITEHSIEETRESSMNRTTDRPMVLEPNVSVSMAPQLRKKEDKSLKVPIPLLDTLMHISGELTVVRNMINKLDRNLKVRYVGDKDLERMSSLLEELHKLNGSIQSHILDLRKVPVKDIVAPLNRVVRDVSKQLGKIIALKVQGAELRIDTSLAELLNNTLIHLVRNSIDHGLETPEERVKCGKTQAGTLSIDAFQENDHVYVRISDDGRGLQTDRIRRRAIENQLITEEQGRLMKDEDLWPLIFAPGFSTAEKVTDISGRGIGMSAVKEAVEAIGGDLVLESKLGVGSSMTVCMPLPKSVLITRCLFILISGMQLGVPNENVHRIVHFDGENDTAQLNRVEDTHVLLLEEELIPVVQLDQILKTPKINIDDAHVKTIAVLRSSKGLALGVVVSDVLEFEDTVVKPFTDHMKAFDIFYGTTFLGDGSIGLIFNVDGLIETCRAQSSYRFNINARHRGDYLHEYVG